jgi:hypothetical protein
MAMVADSSCARLTKGARKIRQIRPTASRMEARSAPETTPATPDLSQRTEIRQFSEVSNSCRSNRPAQGAHSTVAARLVVGSPSLSAVRLSPVAAKRRVAVERTDAQSLPSTGAGTACTPSRIFRIPAARTLYRV